MYWNQNKVVYIKKLLNKLFKLGRLYKKINKVE